MRPDDELSTEAPLVPDLRPEALRAADDRPADQPTTPTIDEP